MVYHWDKQSNWVLYNYSLKVLFCLCFYFWWLIILFLVTMHLLTLKRAELRTLIALLGKCLKHHRQLDNQRLKSCNKRSKFLFPNMVVSQTERTSYVTFISSFKIHPLHFHHCPKIIASKLKLSLSTRCLLITFSSTNGLPSLLSTVDNLLHQASCCTHYLYNNDVKMICFKKRQKSKTEKSTGVEIFQSNLWSRNIVVIKFRLCSLWESLKFPFPGYANMSLTD